VEITLLHLVGFDFAGQHLAYIGQIEIKVVRMRDVLKRSLELFRFAVTCDFTNRAIDPQPFALGRNKGHADGRELERILKKRISC